jgi:hypothetical protein
MLLQVVYAWVLFGVETMFIHLLVCFVGKIDDFVKVLKKKLLWEFNPNKF